MRQLLYAAPLIRRRRVLNDGKSAYARANQNNTLAKIDLTRDAGQTACDRIRHATTGRSQRPAYSEPCTRS